MSRPFSLMAPAVGSISRSTVRATVDLPQPLSPTRPSVSPSPIEKLTPSTARTCPTVRRNKPFFTAKCLRRPLTSSTGVLGIVRARVPAGGPMTRALLLVGRIGRAATLVGQRAARREGATHRQGGERRHHAGNLHQPLGGFRRLACHEVEPRDGGQQTLRIGMQGLGEER